MSTEIEPVQSLSIDEVSGRLNAHRGRLLTIVAATVADGSTFTDGSAQYILSSAWENTIDNHVMDDLEVVQTLTIDDLRQLPQDALFQYGFKYWDENGLMLIALWCWHLIADGAVLYTPRGRSVVKGKDAIDFDNRFGCVFYGFYMDPSFVPEQHRLVSDATSHPDKTTPEEQARGD